MDDWCDQQDFVLDGDRIYRCSKCGKRLHPRKILHHYTLQITMSEVTFYLLNIVKEILSPENEISVAYI